MIDEDQSARLAFDEKTDNIDARHGPELLRIVHRYGWVNNSLAGEDAAHDSGCSFSTSYAMFNSACCRR